MALVATIVVLALLEPIVEPVLRGACAIVLLLGLVASVRGHAWLHGFLLTPVLVLLAADGRNYASVHFFQATIVAFIVVAVCTVLGKWVLWTLRPDTGRAAV
jgi:hypothetical protein